MNQVPTPNVSLPASGAQTEASPPAADSDLVLAPAGQGRSRGALMSAPAWVMSKYGLLVVLIIEGLIFTLLKPGLFLTGSNVNALLSQAAALGVVAFGLTLALSMGDFDLSFGPTAGLAGATAVVLMSSHGVAWPAAIAIALAIGLGAGLVNGLLTAYFGGSAFIMTLASGTAFTGIEYLITGQKTIFANIPVSYVAIGQGNLFAGVSTQIVIGFIVFVLAWILSARMETGRYMKAVGGNPEAARLAGLRVPQLRATGFIIVGLLSGLAGVLLTAQSASSTPDQGAPLLLPAYAAVFLGSTVFRTGEFNIPGTLVGIVVLQVLQNGLTLLNVSPAFINIIQGAVLIVAVLLTLVERGRRR